MKAWEYQNGQLQLQTVDPPEATGDNVIVDVHYSGICGSDVPKLLRPQLFSLPARWRPGHEIVGTDPAGRWVAIDPLVACRHCLDCAAGDSHLCVELKRLGWDLPGGFAEQISVPDSQIHLLPQGLDPLLAALADPAAVAIHGLRCVPVEAPGRLAVIGAGAVGMLTALYAQSVDWTVTVIHREGKEPQGNVIYDDAIAFRSAAHVRDLDPFDVVMDAATGALAAPLELALQLIADGGTVVVLNAYDPEVRLSVPVRDIFSPLGSPDRVIFVLQALQA